MKSSSVERDEFPISRSLLTSRRRTDELGSRLERPIHFECKLNEPMHIGMRLLHPAAADHSVSISRQQVQRIFSFSLRSRAVLIVLLQTYPKAVHSKSLVLVDGDSAVVVSLVEWVAHIRLHYPLLCCSGPSHRGGVPLVSFGAPPDDRISIATSEGESDQSGDDGSVPLSPSGRSAVPDSDPEMVAMLARAAESVGLEWRPPPCPEPSRLDDWFLGVARAGSQGPTLVPFFLEVHDELTGAWTAPFTARNRSSGSSSLATLDGGAARGYTEVPPVERSVAMQLCPRTASTWRGNPLLPSRACRHSSALTGSAYAACGEAGSALHAIGVVAGSPGQGTEGPARGWSRPRSSQ